MIALYSNEQEMGVVYDYDTLNRKTFSPFSLWLVLDKVKGKTYADKKEFVRDTAIHYSHVGGLVPMSWGDVAEIGAWFEKYGRRYGLLREFRENGICWEV